MDFHDMKRSELQALCKKNSIPANLKNVEMADRLSLLVKVKRQEEAKPMKRGRSCLKNLENVHGVDVENVEFLEAKRVRFSPQNETFEFEQTDPRARRLVARKRRSIVTHEMENEPVLVTGKLRGRSVVKCDTGTENSVTVSEDVKCKNPERVLRRRSMVNVSNVEKPVEDEKTKRNLRSYGRKMEQNDVEKALLPPCVEKKAKRGRKFIHCVKEGDVSDKPPDKMVDHGGISLMVTRKQLRSRELTAEESGNHDDGVVEVLKGKKKSENDMPVRRSARQVEKAKAGDHVLVFMGQGNDEEYDPDVNNHPGKTKRGRKKAIAEKQQEFKRVSREASDQENGNMEKPGNSVAFVGKISGDKEEVVVDSRKGNDGGNEGLKKDGLTKRGSRRKNKNVVKNDDSKAMQVARRSTTQAGKCNILSSEGVADANVSRSEIHMADGDNQRVQPVNQGWEARGCSMEKTGGVEAVYMASEEIVPRANSLRENKKPEVEEQYNATEGTISLEQIAETIDEVTQFSSDTSQHLHGVYDPTKQEDCKEASYSTEKEPEIAEAIIKCPEDNQCLEPSLLDNGNGEAKSSEQVMNVLEVPCKLQAPAAENSQDKGALSTPPTIQKGEFKGTSLCSMAAQKNSVDESEPVCHSSEKLAAQKSIMVKNGVDEQLSNSMSGVSDGVRDDEKLVVDERVEPYEHVRNELLTIQESGPRQSPCLSNESKIENATENKVLDHGAVIFEESDVQLTEQEQAAGSSVTIHVEAKYIAPRISDGQGLDQFISEEEILMVWETSTEANVQPPMIMERVTPSEASIATGDKLVEEEEDTRKVTPWQNREAGLVAVIKKMAVRLWQKSCF